MLLVQFIDPRLLTTGGILSAFFLTTAYMLGFYRIAIRNGILLTLTGGAIFYAFECLKHFSYNW